jgi:N-glycosylase/DNA lyase
MPHTIHRQRLACLIGKRKKKIAIGIANKLIRRYMIFLETGLYTAFLLEQKLKNLVLIQNFAVIITFKKITNYIKNELATCRMN